MTTQPSPDAKSPEWHAFYDGKPCPAKYWVPLAQCSLNWMHDGDHLTTNDITWSSEESSWNKARREVAMAIRKAQHERARGLGIDPLCAHSGPCDCLMDATLARAEKYREALDALYDSGGMVVASGNLDAIVWQLRQGKDNGAVGREALAAQLEAVARRINAALEARHLAEVGATREGT